ncbi:hypothetical protein GOODEAATRI_016093, partial [Goodea atripinnis]
GAVEAQRGVLIFCDDPSVQKAVTSALHKFNDRLTTGYKLALFQILSASKVPLLASVSKFNTISNSTHLFTLHRVGHATRQIRRRPPGWSPLRNLVPAPSPAPAKEESSEEDTTSSKPSASPSVNNHPFHCPSNPWKQFKRVQPQMPAAPTDAKAVPSPKPLVEGALSDTDLLS